MAIYRFQADHDRAEVVRGLVRRFVRSMLILLATTVVAAAGFVVLEDGDVAWGERIVSGLWDTLNIVSTVGALPEFSAAQRVWAMLVIVFGLGAVLYGYGSMQALLHGGEIYQWMERRKMEGTLDSIRGHVLLCGYGDVGRAVARGIGAIEPRARVVVVERHDAAVARAEEDGFIVVQGDCTAEGILERAGAARARGVIATLDRDEANVYLCLAVREMNAGARIVTRASREAVKGVLKRAGADRVIVPGELAASQLSQLMLRPKATEFIASAIGDGGYEFVEVPVGGYPGLVGRSIGGLDFPATAGALVVSVVSGDGSQSFNPPADRILEASDTLIVVCEVGSLRRIEALGRA